VVQFRRTFRIEVVEQGKFINQIKKYWKKGKKQKNQEDITQLPKTVIEKEFYDVNHFNTEHALQLQMSNYL
jgi:hypothetical protein